jgi:hypothetical protein
MIRTSVRRGEIGLSRPPLEPHRAAISSRIRIREGECKIRSVAALLPHASSVIGIFVILQSSQLLVGFHRIDIQENTRIVDWNMDD